MPGAQRRAEVVWKGNLFEGSGTITKTGSGVISNLDVTWAARTEEPGGKTSPEELIAAAQAACYGMAFSNVIAKAGHKPEQLDIAATATFVPGTGITTMEIEVVGRVPDIDQARFEDLAKQGEQACPVANALRGNVDIRLKATLAS